MPEVRQQPRIQIIHRKRTIVIEARIACVNQPETSWIHENHTVVKDARRSVKVENVAQVSKEN